LAAAEILFMGLRGSHLERIKGGRMSCLVITGVDAETLKILDVVVCTDDDDLNRRGSGGIGVLFTEEYDRRDPVAGVLTFDDDELGNARMTSV
jgi:hypothetical protein